MFLNQYPIVNGIVPRSVVIEYWKGIGHRAATALCGYQPRSAMSKNFSIETYNDRIGSKRLATNGQRHFHSIGKHPEYQQCENNVIFKCTERIINVSQ